MGEHVGTAEATSAQHAVWFTEHAGVAGTAYHMALGVRFAAELDRRALVAACAAVIERHPVLAARVTTDDDGTPHLAPAETRPTVTVGELTDARVAEEIARPHDLRTGPLARFTLLTGADGTHLLLVTAHHLAFDGMSKDVLARDLATAYTATHRGGPTEPAPRSDGYAGLAAAEQQRVAVDLPAARAYWARHWSGPGDVVLPGLRRLPTGAEPGVAVTVDLPADLVDGVERAARSLGVTRFELLFAALHALLARYGNRGTPVGVALSTRTPDQADRIGLFVNELPVAADPAGGTFRDHARAVRSRLREVYRYRAVPLAHAVSGLRPAPALTPVSIGYRRRGGEPAFPGVAGEVDWTLFCGAARNALHAQIVDAPTGITVSLQHSPSAIDTEAVRRIGGHLRTLLTAAVADPDRPVTDLPVLPADELDRVTRAWNDTTRTYPAGASVPALFAARVAAAPDAPALVDGDRTLSYAQLDAAAARLAELLRQRGVGPGSLVAVALDRSWQAVVTLLAVLRRRAAYLPVDPGHPPARRELVLADAAPALVVTPTATEAARPTLALDRIDLLDGPVPAETAEPPSADDLAYMLYTSGSTGRPKGVAVRHGALANLLLGVRDVLGSGPADRWLHLTSLSFDISAVEVFLPLVTGGRAVVASTVSALDGAGVLRLVRAAGVTHAQATPSGWRVLLEAGLGAPTPGAAEVVPEPLVAVAGGEALPVALARDLRARTARLVNGYGPTEATVYATMADLPADPDEVTIGRPLPNVRAYVLDEARRPAPVGVPGELYLAGAGLAAGYLGRDDLTAERFVPDPFGPAGGRLYRTGDRCRWLPDGRIDFLGRADDQVKIRGHRIELGEIDTRLLDHPGVAGVATVLRRDDDEPRLVAYVVASAGTAPEPAELRRHLALTLPQAVLPTDFVALDRLPLSPNGKVDRAALPAPAPRDAVVDASGAADADPADAGDAGDDPVVEQLRQIWQEVLRIPDIGVHEDLFDLGGHSLTVTRISGRIQQRLGVEVPLDAFFDTPTIAEIAEIVRRSGKEF
ncbi:non-ribosomal peptide synthetase [Micromonospora narathiwatensis]|uniref:Amino acid adenylation domain-containing protein n=1 Tax=Micromonospora narathiwatensis TaxID=299146 RepID=A0A1A8ZQ62_9ACTN|nr:non-ribosomal peptide synthetase [Micromonospora narathiwatensis]SBT46021.1 amino acid adenylation domain-containing protein [Micromonospora narathiwatensis]